MNAIGKPETMLARRFSIFMNWFDGICAPLCGILMMTGLWDSVIPLSIFDNFPAWFREIFCTNLFWPGFALLLVNGVPNIIALIQKRRKRASAYRAWCIAAGALLIVWTAVETIFLPNGVTFFYMVLGILQVIAGLRLPSARMKASNR